MRVRIKFSKTGAMKYIGHLDVMRFFQKALRRAEIPVRFSDGFHPHMLMSFAAPLGVGITSLAEYFDLEIEEGPTSREIIDRLNREMAPGFCVLAAVRIPEEKGSKGMSLVAASDYHVCFGEPDDVRMTALCNAVSSLLAQTEVTVTRRTKRGEKTVDIRPWIHVLCEEGDGLFLRVSSGSVHNLKPETVVAALAEQTGLEFDSTELRVERREVYAASADDGTFVSLAELGENIE